MTPLERAARAAARASASCSEEDRLEYEADWAGYVPLARAVLQAIREPSAKMAEAGANESYGMLTDMRRSDRMEDIPDIWHAMIDAALEEGVA